MARAIIWLILLTSLGVGYFLQSRDTETDVVQDFKPPSAEVFDKIEDNTVSVGVSEIKSKSEKISDTTTTIDKALPLFIHNEVPFIAQAPYGDWSDQRFQDGCEEASMIMAAHWLSKQTLDVHSATQEILRLTDWEIDTYGTYRDTSAEDTVKILRDYFSIDSELWYTLTIADMKEIMANGGVILTPTNGAVLDNPYYTSPPDHHMIVLVGYDDMSKEFITNDPGTKRGEAFRYKYQTVIDASQNYPTGDHVTTDTRTPAFIVIYPQ
jgi:hypothetical protein